MIKVGICGIAGRMGQRISHLTLEAEGLDIGGGVEFSGHPAIGKDIGESHRCAAQRHIRSGYGRGDGGQCQCHHGIHRAS